MSSTDSVKVCVRIRPLSVAEQSQQIKSCIRITSSPDGLSSNQRDESAPQQLIVGKDRAFTFDTILGIDATQEDTFNFCVRPLVESFLEGYNATVLAYGQTGSGKTHTMSGGSVPGDNTTEKHIQGMIPRVISELYEAFEVAKNEVDYKLHVEYIEIYNEELRDLLHPETSSKHLAIREDVDGHIVTAGIKSQFCNSKAAIFRQFAIGNASRVTGSTLMNEQSSRSHAIFSLLLKQNIKSTGKTVNAKFHLVDLAGAERAKRTGAVAGRFKESISINQGLLALGNVISALSRVGNTGASTHIPYRDSKLTRLLQDSLGGNSKTLMIACVSPATRNFEETLNSLKYAHRAKKIKNRPIVNLQILQQQQLLAAEQEQIKEQLEHQLQKAHDEAEAKQKLESQNNRMEKEILSLQAQLDEKVDVENRLHVVQARVESIQVSMTEVMSSLLSMERDIKGLGRPVQHKLNEIVKSINDAIELAKKTNDIMQNQGLVENSSGKIKLLLQDDDLLQRMRQQLQQAKEDLARDEEIFEAKNNELLACREKIQELDTNNKRLIEKIEEIEKKNHLWSGSPIQRHGPDEDELHKLSLPSNINNRCSTKKSITPAMQNGSQAPISSSNFFTKRIATADPKLEDERVRIGDEEDNLGIKSSSKRYETINTSSLPNLNTKSRLGNNGLLHSTEVVKLLQSKIQHLEQCNLKLTHEKEENGRSWQLERENFERSLGEANKVIHGFEKARRQEEDVPELSMDEQIVGEFSEKKIQELLDKSVEEIVVYETAQQQLKTLLKSKEAKMHEKESMQKRLNSLEIQSLRQSLNLQKSISDVSSTLSNINNKLLQEESKTLDELERLKSLKARADRKLNKLRQQEKEQEVFDEEARLECEDLEELISDLNSHITFQDTELTAARQQLQLLQRSQDVSPLDELADKLANLFSQREIVTCRFILRICLQNLAGLRLRQHELLGELKDKEASLNERNATLRQLETGIKATQEEFDRRMKQQVIDCNKLEKELMEANALLKNSNPENEDAGYIVDLEKHVVYYKNKVKQLQEHITQLMKEATDQNDPLNASSNIKNTTIHRIQQLEQANDELMKEIASMKVYFRSSKTKAAHASHVIRLSKNNLREVPEPSVNNHQQT